MTHISSHVHKGRIAVIQHAVESAVKYPFEQNNEMKGFQTAYADLTFLSCLYAVCQTSDYCNITAVTTRIEVEKWLLLQ